MKEFKELTASERLEARILKVTNLLNKELERQEKISETFGLVNKMVKDLDKTSKLLSVLLEQLKTLKTSYSNLRNEQQKVQLI